MQLLVQVASALFGVEMRKCEVTGCPNTHRARGLCIIHYNNLVRFGSVLSREEQIRVDAIKRVVELVRGMAKREKLDAISVDRLVLLIESGK